ncbi:hypothetical protein E2C01_066116 [Portunus trituberculatus]|uniref:Uncharacterized protein n=1 Tax=Portunus trituberculatus TaxID=210409 RepID=A0A5B7HPF0_PORTR|nr:hypothetical protein [Portunus trituberculatus]
MDAAAAISAAPRQHCAASLRLPGGAQSPGDSQCLRQAKRSTSGENAHINRVTLADGGCGGDGSRGGSSHLAADTRTGLVTLAPPRPAPPRPG